VTQPAAKVPLPTRQQLGALRDFLHGRTYSAASTAIQLAGEPPHADDSPMADVRKTSQALYEVVNVLSRRLLDDLCRGLTGSQAEEAWIALLVIARVWRDSPGMPEDVRALVAQGYQESA
jgi:hypothetical protein